MFVGLQICCQLLSIFVWSCAIWFSFCDPVMIIKDILDFNLLTVNTDNDVEIFEGSSTQPDHFFHQVHIENDHLLIGARNVIYNISLMTFTENKRLIWNSSSSDELSCLLKQKTPEDCQNYIRLILKKNTNEFLVCGSNSFRPLCRSYIFHEEKNNYSISLEESGVARCPYDPSHNNTAIFIGDRLFSAAIADLSARDALIYSLPLRTEQHDSQWLNEPNFVNSFGFEDKVYFFFREMAIENINCGKAVFSRVARVCRNDRGGARILRNTWTSFFKARLNCSIPGEFPFYFDEIQSTSDLGNGSIFPTLVLGDRTPMVYGVFTTPKNSLGGSAICAYRFSDVVSSFEGTYKEQKTSYSNWLPIRESDIPDIHPAKVCVNDSLTLSDQTLNFIKSHPLMDKSVPAYGGEPVIVQSNLEYRFTQVAVDWQVYAADHRYYDVLFIGTDDGHVLKVVNKGRGQNMETIVIEVISVFEDKSPVTGIKIYNDLSKKKKVPTATLR